MSESVNFELSDDDHTAFVLPSEILEHIFAYLDAKSFFTSRQVCKTWNEVIKLMQYKKSIWRQFCIKEIPKNVLEEILWFKRDTLLEFDWMNIYKKWFFSRMIKNSPCWKKKIRAFCENPVTAVRISGSWIITGHANGRLSIWNMLTGDLCQSFMCHLKIILDMALVDLLNLGSYFGYEELPWSHHHIITISRDRYIHILSLLEPMISTDSDIHINFHSDDLSQVRVFDDNFAVSSRDNTVTLWKMKTEMKPYFHLDVSLLRTIAGPIDYLLCLGLWHDQVQCITHGSRLKWFRPEDGEWETEWQIPLDYSGERPYYLMRTRSAFLYGRNTALLFSGNGKIIISVNSFFAENYVRQKLGTDIITVAFYGTILALGGENGRLFLYHIPHEEQLPYRDLTKPDCVLSLSAVSIITIDISLQYDAPVVAACTTNNIYIVKWYRKDAEAKVQKRDILESFMKHL